MPVNKYIIYKPLCQYKIRKDDMSITVKEIAKIAGVARATVDRALNNRGGINEDTRKRIVNLAEEYGYRPNKIGKALVFSAQKHKIGIILNSLGNAFFDEVLDGIESSFAEIEDYGFEKELLQLKGYNVAEQARAIDTMVRKGCRSIIITPINDIAIAAKVGELIKNGINVIFVNSQCINDSGVPYVGCDYYMGGRTAGNLVRLFAENGAKLLLVTGNRRHKGHAERIKGIEDVLTGSDNYKIVAIAENDDDENASYEIVKHSLDMHKEIDFICVTAGGAEGAMKAISESDKRYKTVTFDETNTIKRSLRDGIVLATVTQEPFRQGYESVKEVFDNCMNKKRFYDILTEIHIKVKENM